MARVVQSEQAMFVMVLREAQAGNAGAQYELGTYYMLGKGVTQDSKQALFWLLKAAHQGHSAAQRLAGNIYARAFEDYDEAIRWYRISAKAGNAKARFNLGIMYQIGYGVEKDYEMAFHWQQLSAQQGYSIAQFNLGLLYGDGRGTQQDDRLAFEWLHRAAEQNHATAQFNIGSAYENARGVARDMPSAVRWYRRAAYNGDYSAQVALAGVLLEEKHSGSGEKTGQAYVWMAVASRAQTLPDTISGKFSDISRSLPQDEANALNELVTELVGVIKHHKISALAEYITPQRLAPTSSNA